MRERPTFIQSPLDWHFPAAWCHDGIPLGNGTFGALVWGDGSPLKITINRQDYWDHHGGHEWPDEATYANLRRFITEGNEEELRRVFEGRSNRDERPPRPTRLPMGRIDVGLGEDTDVAAAQLDLFTGEARLTVGGEGRTGVCRLTLLREQPLLAVRVDGVQSLSVIPQPVDAPDVIDHLASLGYPGPRALQADDMAGWTQERPGEDALAVACRSVNKDAAVELFVCAVYGATESEAVERARDILGAAAQAGYADLHERTARWWEAWWKQGARVELPDSNLELLYYLGMHKLAGISVPGSPAATLQGPWVEEDRLPPWSSDYHFNINVQECYWPAYGGNHLETLEPLFDMIQSWMPRLRHNARIFAGADDGVMLPHAVDDRCVAMGGFWTGALDHGSTAWTGQLMWQYYQYTHNGEFLASTAYPFLKGCMRVYEVMLEDDGDALCLPLGVSPEFGGSNFDACGKNASFQLAIIHFLCRALVEASETLDVDEDDRARWRDIDRRLPVAATSGPDDTGSILLWEGQPLTESHRHHSHLAGVYPFDVLRDEHRALANASMRHLTAMGMGRWSGWCLPWAAILFARTGRPDMATTVLEAYRRAFTTRGHASLHDARFPGLTLIASRLIMQIEAAMGASAAVLELLVQCSQGVVRVFPAVPDEWEDASFINVRAAGAFLISAKRVAGRTTEVSVLSEAGRTLRLANPFGASDVVVGGPDGSSRMGGAMLTVPTAQGETYRIRAIAQE